MLRQHLLDLEHDEEGCGEALRGFEATHGALAHASQPGDLLLREPQEIPGATRLLPERLHPPPPGHLVDADAFSRAGRVPGYPYVARSQRIHHYRFHRSPTAAGEPQTSATADRRVSSRRGFRNTRKGARPRRLASVAVEPRLSPSSGALPEITRNGTPGE